MRFHITLNQWRYTIITVLVLAGCATAGRNFKSSNLPMIEINRTMEGQIRMWFGKPYIENTVKSSGFETKILHYLYAKETLNGISRNRELYVEISDGLVYSYFFHSAFPEDATDFDTELRNQLKIGQTTMADAKGILGAPGGKYQLPTNALSEELCNEAPEGTKEIWCYLHVTSERKKIVFKRNIKELFLYFDGTGVLAHLLFHEGS